MNRGRLTLAAVAAMSMLASIALVVARSGRGEPSNPEVDPRSAPPPAQSGVEPTVQATRIGAADRERATPSPSSVTEPKPTGADAELMRRYRFLVEQARKVVRQECPEVPIPSSVSDRVDVAREFVEAYAKLTADLEKATATYRDALVDWLNPTTLQAARKLPAGEDPLDFRDRVLAGTHEGVRLEPGDHIITMSDSYLLVRRGESAWLDYLGTDVAGIRRSVAPHLYTILLGAQ